MNNQNNNVLTYFIKDIKDAKERAFYKQINNDRIIQILYKDKLLYEIHNGYRYNYIHNIIKSRSKKYICKSNISYNYFYNAKHLYYKNDNKVKGNNRSLNCIIFNFNYNKYLNKRYFYYVINNNQILILTIIYFKKYKYIMNYNIYIGKFTSPHILIPNKYELDYYCKFVNIYFVNKWRIIGE
jgi:hypothetical protein